MILSHRRYWLNDYEKNIDSYILSFEDKERNPKWSFVKIVSRNLYGIGIPKDLDSILSINPLNY